MSNDYDHIALRCQKYLENVPTIVIGSGFSIPYGLPSMWSLGDKIKKKLTPIYKDKKEWDEFIKVLDAEQNLELALQKVALSPEMHSDIVTVTWESVNEKDSVVFENLLKNRCDMVLSKIFNKLLESHPKTVSVITSNYDRLIEYAADLSCVKVDTGFYGEYIRNIISINLANDCKDKKVILCKVHGSLDWFKREIDHQLISISNTREIRDGLRPVIVAPGIQKYEETHFDPYRTLISTSDQIIDSASSYLCIGYGFNDEHLQPKLIQNIQRLNKPIVIVAKKLSDKGKEILQSSQKYMVFEEESKGKTRVNIDGTEEVMDGDLWQLFEFAKLWLGLSA